MSREEAVLLITPTISVYLVIWALTDLTYIPQNLFALADHASLTAIVSENYLRNYDLIYLAFSIHPDRGTICCCELVPQLRNKRRAFLFPVRYRSCVKGFSTPSWKTLWKNRTILA